MAYLDTLKLVTGDTLPDLRFVLKDASSSPDGVTYDANDSSTWAPIDLTGATVALRIRLIGSTTVTATLAGIVSDPEGGAVLVPFTGNSFGESGLYEGELEITFATGGIQTVYDLVKFKVRNDFD
jgi:hypothetical protein